MQVNVPKASDLKKFKHPLKHDVSTTCDIGFMQPFMVREFPGDSTIKVSSGQIVRFANMVKPTFGTISLNTYNVFVPIESIYHPYASLRSGQTYMGANATYIPEEVITCSPLVLNTILKLMSSVEFWVGDQNSIVMSGNDIRVISGSMSISPDWAASFNTWLAYLGDVFTDSGYFENPVSPVLNNCLGSIIGSSPTKVLRTGAEEFDSADGYDWIDVIDFNANGYILACGRYNRAARNIRKVLYGCGYKLLDDGDPLTFLPVLAYYKAWFDLFAPQREITWKDTPAAGLQEWCEQYGIFQVNKVVDKQYIDQSFRLFVELILDLAKCYYTQNPDFVSAHISGQKIGTTPDITLQYQPRARNAGDFAYISSKNSGGVASISNTSNNYNPNYSTVLNNLLTAQGIELLMKVQKRVNVHTALGGRIREILKSITGEDYLDEDNSYWIGSQKCYIGINPVFNTAESSEAALGQFAGAAFGDTRSSLETLTYQAKETGFWVCFGAVVPDAAFAQGMDMMLKHIGRYDFWDSLYDSVTLLPTSKKYIFAENQISMLGDQAKKLSGNSFGNMPSQVEYCVSQNIQNGDMSLMSTRATYLAWTLDKLLPYDHIYHAPGGDSILVRVDPTNIVEGTIWRYVGLSLWIGQYDRIFEQSGTVVRDLSPTWDNVYFYTGQAIDDNITMQSTLFCEYWHYKLPIASSYNTGVIEGGMKTEIA